MAMHQRVRPKKSLSQNFLVDESVARKIAMSLDVREGACVVEIGPGAMLGEHREVLEGEGRRRAAARDRRHRNTGVLEQLESAAEERRRRLLVGKGHDAVEAHIGQLHGEARQVEGGLGRAEGKAPECLDEALAAYRALPPGRGTAEIGHRTEWVNACKTGSKTGCKTGQEESRQVNPRP